MDTGTVISSILAVVISLGVVLGLAWLSIRGLRLWQDRIHGTARSEDDEPIRFLRAMPLGQRERVAMVRVRGEVLLLGVTAGGISLLARWPADEAPSDFTAIGTPEIARR